jgi:hypothetical protein
MKLRIRGDSLRLRLTRGEVAALAARGAVEEATHFPEGAALRYRLLAERDAPAPSARFAAGVLTVALPEARARAWAASEDVSIEAAVPCEGGTLRILVEKDFPCPTSRPGEDDSDAFARGAPAKGG